jgi:uridine phosphorylase
MIANRLHLKLKDLKVPKYIFLSLSVGAIQPLIKETKAEEVVWIYRARPLYVGNVSGNPVGIIWAAPGAPLATVVMEDLIACGAKLFIGIGLLGAFQPSINVGDYIIPSWAVRDEGTSHHYLPENIKARSSKKIIHALQNSCEEFKVRYCIGPIWTTDAPYRETKSTINFFQGKGILGVDAESSAIFSLGIYRKVNIGCLLVASTNLTHPRATLGLYTKSLEDAMLRAVRISTRALRRLASIKEPI